MIYLSEKETNETIYFMRENLLTSSTPIMLDFDLDICETSVISVRDACLYHYR